VQCIIHQVEIERAIREYIENKFSVSEGQTITLQLAATRGAKGYTATIDISDSEVQETLPVVKHRQPKPAASPVQTAPAVPDTNAPVPSTEPAVQTTEPVVVAGPVVTAEQPVVETQDTSVTNEETVGKPADEAVEGSPVATVEAADAAEVTTGTDVEDVTAAASEDVLAAANAATAAQEPVVETEAAAAPEAEEVVAQPVRRSLFRNS
jgi:hypothetical protein